MGKALTSDDIQTVLEFADNNMVVYATAKKVYASTGTVSRRLKKVKKYTRLNPFNFADLVKLVGKYKDHKDSKWRISCEGYYPYCPECGEKPPSGKMTNFCPNCGKDMRGEYD